MLDKSNRWGEKMHVALDGVAFETSPKNTIACSLFHLSNEHYFGGHILLSTGVRGSAFALFRPQFDAFVRGLWAQGPASDSEVIAFADGASPPRLSAMIASVENSSPEFGKIISTVTKNAWTSMCDFTHGGALQIRARAHHDVIEQRYTDQHCAQLLEAMCMLSYHASLCILGACGNESQAKELCHIFRECFPIEN